MKAITQDRYGGPEVLSVEDIDPPEPAAGEVLLRVQASSVNMADIDYLRGRPAATRFATGLRQPKNRVPGTDVAGVVEAVGPDVKRFAPGDEVFGDLTGGGSGAYAELVATPERCLAPKPSRLTFEQAAATPSSGILATQALRAKGGVESGQHVLVNGAGGNVGPFAVQIAKATGAEVTAVDRGDKLDLLRSIGADHVIDYTEVDYMQAGERYDRIVDIASQRSIFTSRRALRPGGVYVWVGGSLSVFVQAMLLGPFVRLATRRNIGIFEWRPFRAEDVAFLSELLEDGKVVPAIDRVFPLDAVADAMRYQESGQANGKIVIRVARSSPSEHG